MFCITYNKNNTVGYDLKLNNKIYEGGQTCHKET